MKKILVIVAAVCLLPAGVARSQDAKPTGGSKEAPKSELSIEKAVIAKGVDKLEPVEPGESFKKDVGKVYCVVKVVGAKAETEIKFIWLMGDKNMGTVSVPVKSSPWRTFSYKTIEQSMTGDWQVEIRDANDALLTTVSFKIE